MTTKLRLITSTTILAAVAGLASACGTDATTAGPAEVRVASNYDSDPKVSELIADWQEPEGPGELALPHLAFKETAFTTTTALSYEVADAFELADDYDLEDGESLEAPEGREFLVVELELRDRPWRTPGGSSDSPVVVTITTGPMAHRAQVEVFERGEASVPTETILVTVETGDDVTIEIRDAVAGGIAAMNLRSGEPVDDPPPASALYYPLPDVGTAPPTATAGPATAVSSLVGSDGAPQQLVLTSTGEITRHAWTPTAGWASEGRCWLEFEQLRLTATEAHLPVDMRLDPWAEISVLADGQPVELQQRFGVAVGIIDFYGYHDFGVVYVDVPCDASTYTLVYAPEPTSRDGGDLGTWTPGSAEFSFPK